MSNQFFPRLLAIAFALVAISAVRPVLHAAQAKPPKAAPAIYKGAIVVNEADGAVLFEDNADVVTPPASITKLMTFLIVHDAIEAGQISLGTPVTATAEDSKIGGTQVWLAEKEVYPVEELLYALMIQSANDCANALARATAGSRDAFVERMNARARALGMTGTTFTSPHGLPPSNRKTSDGDLSTPRDLAILARHLLANTDILKYTSVRIRTFGEGVRPQKTQIMMVNHNKLLGRVAGVDGLKTGYTASAGFCLAATAGRNGNRLIVVTMGTPNRLARDTKVAELIESSFAKIPASPVSPVTPVAPVSSTAPAPASVSGQSLVPSATQTASPSPALNNDEIPKIVFPQPSSSSRSNKK